MFISLILLRWLVKQSETNARPTTDENCVNRWETHVSCTHFLFRISKQCVVPTMIRQVFHFILNLPLSVSAYRQHTATGLFPLGAGLARNSSNARYPMISFQFVGVFLYCLLLLLIYLLLYVFLFGWSLSISLIFLYSQNNIPVIWIHSFSYVYVSSSFFNFFLHAQRPLSSCILRLSLPLHIPRFPLRHPQKCYLSPLSLSLSLCCVLFALDMLVIPSP